MGGDSIHEACSFSDQDPISYGGAGKDEGVGGASCDVTYGRFTKVLDCYTGLARGSENLTDIAVKANGVHFLGVVLPGAITKE